MKLLGRASVKTANWSLTKSRIETRNQGEDQKKTRELP